MMIGLGVEYDPETGMEIPTVTDYTSVGAGGTSQYEAEDQWALQQADQAIEQLEWDPSLDTAPPGTTTAQIQKQAAAVTALKSATAATTTSATAAAIAAALAAKTATVKKTTATTQTVACKSGVDTAGKCKDVVPGLANNYLVMGAGIFGMLMIVLVMGGRR